MSGGGLVKNTITLTTTNMLMRVMGLLFQIYISKKIGAAGIGLFTLVLSVNMTAATFAISGGRFAATRLVSEELGKGSMSGAFAAVRHCLGYSSMFGIAAGVLTFLLAPVIGEKIIGDERTVLAIKCLAVGLPFLSGSAVISGYFTAIRKVHKGALGDIFEQLVRMASTVLIFSYIPADDPEKACAALVFGGAAGEIAAFFLHLALYLNERNQAKVVDSGNRQITGRMLKIALPLAFSAYTRTALSTFQNVLVPKGFRKGGATAERALASYGEVQGMVLPIVTFPAAIFVSLAETLVPELTRAQVKKQDEYITEFASRLLKLCLLFSIGVMGVFLLFHDKLGLITYGVESIGHYIKLLACLMPIMYLDTVTDGMLRGLGEQVFSMRINIIDSVISLILVYVLLPKYGVYGYIFILYFSEIFNISFSLGRLVSLTGLRLNLKDICKALVSVVGAANVSIALGRAVSTFDYLLSGLIFEIVSFLFFYVGLLFILGCFDKKDIASFKRRLFLRSRKNKSQINI